MRKTEGLHQLSSYSDNAVSFDLAVASDRYIFVVNTDNLKNLARFFGFAEVRIAPTEQLLENEGENTEVVSKVRDLPTGDLPLKAQWKAIDIYLNIPLIRQNLASSFENQDLLLGLKLQELIKRELKMHGKENFKKVDVDLLALDIANILLFAIVGNHVISILESHNPSHTYAVLLACTVIRALINTLDSFQNFSDTAYGARIAPFQGLQAERLLLAEPKTHLTSIIHLVLKGLHEVRME